MRALLAAEKRGRDEGASGLPNPNTVLYMRLWYWACWVALDLFLEVGLLRGPPPKMDLFS